MGRNDMEQFGVPVLFIIFNRFENTKKVFEQIKTVKPTNLYIASDGPRGNVNGEDLIVNSIREYVLSNVDWNCEVKTFFQEENLSCGPNVKSSIDWFFKHEASGIILEDDCVPSFSFFRFCEELLDKYKDDLRIGMISGTNYWCDKYKPMNSYLFSKNYKCWGWATWKRSWVNMDFEMSWLETKESYSIIQNMGNGRLSTLHWKNAIGKIQNRVVNTWDWQWYFSLSFQNQVCIFPKTNLVSNVGFWRNSPNNFAPGKTVYLANDEINFPLEHPKYMVVDKFFDNVIEKHKMRTQVFKNLVPAKLRFNIIKWLKIKNKQIETDLGIYEYRPIILAGGNIMNLAEAKINLIDFKKILDSERIKFGLFKGTLLGAVREGNFIENDTDIDIYILDEFRQAFQNILFKLLASGFEVARYNYDFLTLIRDDNYIDISFYKKVGDTRISGKSVLKESFFKSNSTIRFLEMEFNVPNNYIDFLKHAYGENWRIPDKENHAILAKGFAKYKIMFAKLLPQKVLYFFIKTLYLLRLK